MLQELAVKGTEKRRGAGAQDAGGGAVEKPPLEVELAPKSCFFAVVEKPLEELAPHELRQSSKSHHVCINLFRL